MRKRITWVVLATSLLWLAACNKRSGAFEHGQTTAGKERTGFIYFRE